MIGIGKLQFSFLNDLLQSILDLYVKLTDAVARMFYFPSLSIYFYWQFFKLQSAQGKNIFIISS